jgi:hypothetical protein
MREKAKGAQVLAFVMAFQGLISDKEGIEWLERPNLWSFRSITGYFRRGAQPFETLEIKSLHIHYFRSRVPLKIKLAHEGNRFFKRAIVRFRWRDEGGTSLPSVVLYNKE